METSLVLKVAALAVVLGFAFQLGADLTAPRNRRVKKKLGQTASVILFIAFAGIAYGLYNIRF